MQTIPSSRFIRPSRGPVVVGTVVGGILVAGGLGLAWLALTTPVISGLTPSALRPGPEQLLVGGIVWAVALVAPPSFAIVGILRLTRVLHAVTAKPPQRAIAKVASTLDDEYISVSELHLPEGRVVRDVVAGPYGLAVLFELPRPEAVRRHGTAWEVRLANGRWMPYENPLERASRDAERVRRWIAAEERDFVVKVFAAVVTNDQSLSRSASCAVVTPEQIPAWLASLPAARALTPSRREDLIARLRLLA